MIRITIDKLKAFGRRIAHGVLPSIRDNQSESQTHGEPDKAHNHNLSDPIRAMIREEIKKATSGE